MTKSSETSSLELALGYLDYFYNGKPGQLKSILADNLHFEGPLATFRSRDEYLRALQKDPPGEMNVKIIETFEKNSSACLIYQFKKAGIQTTMAQVFTVYDKKISKIKLIFDSADFK